MDPRDKVKLYRRLLRKAQAELRWAAMHDFPDGPFWISGSEMKRLQQDESWIQGPTVSLRQMDSDATHRFIFEQSEWDPGFVNGRMERMYLVRLVPTDWTTDDIERHDNPNLLGD